MNIWELVDMIAPAKVEQRSFQPPVPHAREQRAFGLDGLVEDMRYWRNAFHELEQRQQAKRRRNKGA